MLVMNTNTRAILLFFVFNRGIERVCAAGDIDPAYRDALAEAITDGLEVQAWRVEVSPSALTLSEPLPFSLDP